MTFDTKHLLNWATWFRGIVIVLLGIALYYLLYYVVSVLALIQLVLTLILGAKNPQLQGFGAMLADFMSASLRYVTFASDDPPPPFDQIKM